MLLERDEEGDRRDSEHDGSSDQPLYDVRVELAVDDTRLERWQGRVGFRTVRLDTIPDEHGTSFVIVVNDQPIFVRGANWIPDDAFVTRVTRDRYAARVAQSKDASINLLRVWGVGSTKVTSSTTSATRRESWCGRTSSSPAPPTRRRSRYVGRSWPRRATTSRVWYPTRAWCCGTATTRTSGDTTPSLPGSS